jgi:hypothetical protein
VPDVCAGTGGCWSSLPAMPNRCLALLSSGKEFGFLIGLINTMPYDNAKQRLLSGMPNRCFKLALFGIAGHSRQNCRPDVLTLWRVAAHESRASS